jgi:hypothetical protein
MRVKINYNNIDMKRLEELSEKISANNATQQEKMS